MLYILRLLILIVAGTIHLLPSSSLASEIRVVTPLSEAEAAELFSSFARETGIQVKWKSTPAMTTLRDLTKGIRNYDLWFGVPSHTLEEAKQRNLLTKVGIYYRGASLCASRCGAENPYWHAVFIDALGIAVNGDVLDGERSFSWHDLIDPELKGRICLPSPEHSHAGYLLLQTFVSRLGEMKGFEALAAAMKNARSVNKSGKSCVTHVELEASYVAPALGSDIRKNTTTASSLILVLPSEGVATFLNGIGILRSIQDREALNRFLDWSVNSSAQETLLRWGHIPVNDTVTAEWIPSVLYRPDMSGNNRHQLLAKWKSYYAQSGGSFPKKGGYEKTITRDSNWRGGGGSQPGYCAELRVQLQREYPDAQELETITSSEQTRDNCTPFRCIQYQYRCTVTVRGNPVLKELESNSSP